MIGWYAPVVMMIGVALWIRGSLMDSVIMVLFFSLFDGGAAFTIGGSSIQPVAFSLVFILAHALLLLTRPDNKANLGLKTNGFFAFFCLYGAATSYLLPRIFARQMVLPPMLPNKNNIYYATILNPSSQNITTAIYLLGAMIASICAGGAVANPKSRRALVGWSVVFSWLQVFFGVFGVVATKIGATRLIAFFRNAKYAELDQTTAGFVRISGISPEPSAYGGHTFVWFVLMAELWLRGVKPKWTGPTAAALLIMIVLCTSSTAYFSLAGYAAILLVRWIIAPDGLRPHKLLLVGVCGLSAIAFGLGLAAFSPKFADLIVQAFSSMTVHKLASKSGMGRSFWLKAGIEAFVKSYGLGVGPGSFRCSSEIASILGSMGVIGISAFVGHLWTIFQPLKAGTYRRTPSGDPVCEAAAWAACVGLLPAAVSAPGPEPSFVFAILGGLVLGWRALAARNPRTAAYSTPAPLPLGATPVEAGAT